MNLKLNLDKPKNFVKKHRKDIDTIATYTMGVVAGGAAVYIVLSDNYNKMIGEQIQRIDLFSVNDIPGFDHVLQLTKLNGTTEVHLVDPDLPFPG